MALLALLLVIFLISLPGFGIETRTTSQYSAWAGPVFLVLTILVFALGVSAFVTSRRRARASASLAIGAGLAAIATNLLDFSHVGGPAPPTGPLVLGILATLVAVVLIVGGSTILRSQVALAPS